MLHVKSVLLYIYKYLNKSNIFKLHSVFVSLCKITMWQQGNRKPMKE